MLKRLGKEPLDPGALLSRLKQAVFAVRQFSPLIQEGLAYLEAHVDQVQFGEKVVCHCDVNHNNWLLSEDNQLYLIDWDGAMIADPAMDLGPLLYHYVEEPAWDSWLGMYGMKLTEGLRRGWRGTCYRRPSPSSPGTNQKETTKRIMMPWKSFMP